MVHSSVQRLGFLLSVSFDLLPAQSDCGRVVPTRAQWLSATSAQIQADYACSYVLHSSQKVEAELAAAVWWFNSGFVLHFRNCVLGAAVPISHSDCSSPRTVGCARACLCASPCLSHCLLHRARVQNLAEELDAQAPLCQACAVDAWVFVERASTRAHSLSLRQGTAGAPSNGALPRTCPARRAGTAP